MSSDTPLPTAPQIVPTRVTRPRRVRRLVIAAALAVGVIASASAVAATQTDIATQAGASLTSAKETAHLAPLSIGEDALTEAELTLAEAQDALEQAIDGVETDRLNDYVTKLEDYEELPRVTVEGLTAEAADEIGEVVAQTAEVQDELERQKERERQAAEAVSSAQTPDGARAAARQIASDDFGWGEGEFSCLSSLWQKESGWNYQAQNTSSGAYGIPQSLPGSKMATVASDWQTNPLTQIRWGLQYIQAAYGTPCAAWGHSQAVDWY